MANNRAVLYLRLSKEDVDKLIEGDDSASIKNQRLLLTDFALDKGFKIVKVYSDDDESGLYDDRPGFEEMMTDAKLGMFDVIIAKTQARFSRNMEHIEKYLHHDLPNLGVRFIGAIDGVDTDDESNKKSRQINGLVNEWYCEDLSKNIRSAFRAKMKDGQFLGSSCSYGYKKDPLNHNHLIVDEYAANVVKRIYNLYLEGYGKAKIGAILSSEGILIPTIYKKKVLGEKFNNGTALETTSLWCYQTIHTILNNEVYTGKLIQNKVNTLSYKDKKRKRIPKEKWIVVNNTHEAIIDEETFKRVKELQKTRTRSIKSTEPNGVFSGMLFCADCKHAMSRKYARRGEKRFIGYVCKTYKTQGKRFCGSHSVDVEDLEQAVLTSIKEEARKILRAEDLNELNNMQVVEAKYNNYEEQLREIDKQLDKINKYKRKTYENLMDELITRDEYIGFVADYDRQAEVLKGQRKAVVDKSDLQDEMAAQYDEWVIAFRDYINIDKLTREVVLELIERIEIHNDGLIDIYYRFKNPYVS